MRSDFLKWKSLQSINFGNRRTFSVGKVRNKSYTRPLALIRKLQHSKKTVVFLELMNNHIMNKMKFSLIAIIIVALSSCQSNKKKEITDHSTDREANIQQRVENNIYKIEKNGKNDSTATTIESRMEALNISGVSITVFDNNKILWSKGYGKKIRKQEKR